MKKKILLLTLVVFLGILNVKAATENELLAKISQGYLIENETIKVSDYYVSEAKRYLNKYDVSENDAELIITKINEIYELAKADKVKTFTDLSDASKAKAISIVAEISNKTSVKATLTKNGILTIYESDGKTVFTEIKDADITKQTGSNNIVFIITSIVSVFGILYVAKKAVSTNA